MAQVISAKDFGDYWAAFIVFSKKDIADIWEVAREGYTSLVTIICAGSDNSKKCREAVEIDVLDQAAGLIVLAELSRYCHIYKCPIPPVDEYIALSKMMRPRINGRWWWSGGSHGTVLEIVFDIIDDENIKEEITEWVEKLIKKKDLDWKTDPIRSRNHWALVVVKK